MDEKKKPRMKREDRAKQFSPFSALTGLEAALLKKELEMQKNADESRYEEEDEPS